MFCKSVLPFNLITCSWCNNQVWLCLLVWWFQFPPVRIKTEDRELGQPAESRRQIWLQYLTATWSTQKIYEQKWVLFSHMNLVIYVCFHEMNMSVVKFFLSLKWCINVLGVTWWSKYGLSFVTSIFTKMFETAYFCLKSSIWCTLAKNCSLFRGDAPVETILGEPEVMYCKYCGLTSLIWLRMSSISISC